MYRGLPCIYSSAILSSASLLSGGSMALLRVLAMAMIIFMISQSFYPHDRVLESQAWKKVVFAGGKNLLVSHSLNMWHLQRHKHHGDSSEQILQTFFSCASLAFIQNNTRHCVFLSLGVVMVFCSSFPPACVYYLLWSVSYILFPTSLWSSKVLKCT